MIRFSHPTPFLKWGPYGAIGNSPFCKDDFKKRITPVVIVGELGDEWDFLYSQEVEKDTNAKLFYYDTLKSTIKNLSPYILKDEIEYTIGRLYRRPYFVNERSSKMTFNPTLKVQALSKREASKLTPPDRALLISIQDGEKSHLPFKQRTNHITRDKYIATLFTYFDDVQEDLNPFAFGINDARQIINFLNRHFQKPGNFDRIIVHCQAGVSRSQAVALFIAKYYYDDENLYKQLLNQEGKVPGGNRHVYELLEKTFKK